MPQVCPVRTRTHRPVGAALLVGAVLGSLVSCGGAAEAPPAAESPTSSSAAPPPQPPPVLWPLTGLESGAVPPRPALAVKIENSVDARPQTGLGGTDMVWEEVVEGGITRFVAVYHSTLPVEIGPVRSVRPMDPAIAAPLHGLFAFSGGAKGYLGDLQDAGLQLLSNDSGVSGFYRIDSRSAPHNVYADPTALVAQADPQHLAPPTPQFEFAPTPQESTAATAGTPAGSLDLTLSGVSHPNWAWDPAGGRWLRAEKTTPATDADGNQLGAANVVVLRVDVVETARVDAAGNPVPETVLVGQGDAMVASAGTTVPVRWAKNSTTDRLVLLGSDGNPVRLAPGNTWVELVPNGSGAVTVR